MKNQEPVRNVFTRRERDFDYETAPVGTNVYGLTKIKNVIIESTYGSAPSERPGYQLTFRMKDNPNAFVVYKQTAGLGDRSNLGKALKRMCKLTCNLKDLDPEQAYKHLMSCENKWFEVTVKHNPWKTAEGETIIFAKVDDNDIRPVDLPGVPTPDVFFNGAGAKSNPVRSDPAWVIKKEVPPPEIVPAKLEDDDIPW